MLIDALKAKQYNGACNTKSRIKEPKVDCDINKTLKGVLVNNHIKSSIEESSYSFSEIQDSLLICDNLPSYYENPKEEKNFDRNSSFDTKKALKPLVIGTGLILAGCLGVSSILKQSSKTILNTKSFEQLPDLAVNMNIKEETQFALYRAIRDPNFKNILATTAVLLMTGITLVSKNFVEGAKEVWLKKKSADIEKDLQENLIEVERNAFSGKLKIVNDMLSHNMKFFDKVLNNKEEKQKVPPIFSGFMSFKGNVDEKKQTFNGENKEERKNNIKFVALVGTVLASAIFVGAKSFSNLKKIAQNSNNFANSVTESTINAINALSETPNKSDLPQVTEFLKSICAKPDYVREVGKKYRLNETEIQTIISAVNESKKTIFADAPTALGGIPKKVQYYCYIDENRGHLYNWILNPENKFTKYIFGAFTLTSSIGYLFKQGMDAIKEVTVLKENSKTELDLRKRLVDVEIRNFKAKKESAVAPLIENFTKQALTGAKTKEELKQLADNILMETKNGPPYIYN